MNRLKWLILASVIGSIIFVWAYQNVLLKPFSFVHITYLEEEKNFNAAPKALVDRYDLNVTLPLKDETYADMLKLLKQFERPKAEQDRFENDISTLTRTVRHLIAHAQGEDIRTKDEDFLSTDTRFKHICSEASKLTVAYAQAIGYKGRVVWMDGHTVSEIYADGYGWTLVDTYGNLMFYEEDQPASLLDVVADYDRYEPRVIITPRYPQNTDYLSSGYLDQEHHVFNDQWLFVVLEGADLLSIHQTSRDLGEILQSVLEIDTQAEGMQFVGLEDQKVGNVGLGAYRRLIHDD